MRILELNFEKYWRGGERQTIYAMEGFIKAGHSATLICRKGSPLAIKAVNAGLDVFACKGVKEVVRILFSSSKKYDILHCQTSNMLTWCIATKWWHRRPIVLSRRVSYVPHGFFTILKYRKANKIIAISNAVKNILLEQGIRNVSVISDIAVKVHIDKKRATDFILEYNCNGKAVITTMAALEPEKDPLTMIRAIKVLHEKRNDFVFMHFGDGSLHSIVKEKIKEFDLQNIYFVPGFVEEVQDFFSVTDVFAFSSIEEGLGSSILDAFLYRVPVASTNGGGLKDLVSKERGLISNALDEMDLAANINKLLGSEELRLRLVNNAEKYVSSMHSMEYITARYIDEFSKIIAP